MGVSPRLSFHIWVRIPTCSRGGESTWVLMCVVGAVVSCSGGRVFGRPAGLPVPVSHFAICAL